MIGVKTLDDIERAFVAMAAHQAGALIVMPGATFLAARRRLADLSVKNRIPTMYAQREYVEAADLPRMGRVWPISLAARGISSSRF